MSNQTTITPSQLASTSESKSVGSPAPPPPPPRGPPNLPLPYLIDGPRVEYLRLGVPLFEASIRCNLRNIKGILNTNPELVRYSITENGETALHLAATVKRSNKQVEDFVKFLVDRMEDKDLALENKNYETALSIAVVAGNLKTVQILVQKYRRLLTIPIATTNMLPLSIAALYGHHEVVKYLYMCSNELCDDGWNPTIRGLLLENCVQADMFGVALKIVDRYPNLESRRVLLSLARKPTAFYEKKPNIIKSSNLIALAINSVYLRVISYKHENEALLLLRAIRGKIAERHKNEIEIILDGPPESKDLIHDLDVNRYSSRIPFIAAEMGNTKFLVELIRQYPDLIWKVDIDNKQSIFHVAVKYRHEDIYSLLYELGSMKDLITSLRDVDGNNMLHLAGMMTTKTRLGSGAAFQMQAELLWFMKIKSTIPPFWQQKNKDGLTPDELFLEEHRELIREGEKGVKETAAQFIVGATLIATITFAAAFTVPGGFDQNHGNPVFYRKTMFQAFVVTDAISLVLSSISILTLLSIFTSHYTEIESMKSLPHTLLMGILTLVVSIVFMIFSFTASLFVLYDKTYKWIPILICVVTFVTANEVPRFQFSLFYDVFYSVKLISEDYGFKPKKQYLWV